MSMLSMPGEDEGTGGVVPSRSIGGVLMWSFRKSVSEHSQWKPLALTHFVHGRNDIGAEETASGRCYIGAAAMVSGCSRTRSEECGGPYLWSMWKLASRSAVKLEVGDELVRAGFRLK